MVTRIKKLERSLRNAKEKQDISKLNNISNRVDEAHTVLKAHIFQPHRADEIVSLASLFFDVRRAIAAAKDASQPEVE